MEEMSVEPLLCGSGGSIVSNSKVTMAKDLAMVGVARGAIVVVLLSVSG